MKQPANYVQASSVIGVNVINQQKETLGKIEDIMINKPSGEVAYLVLSFGGFLGMGDKLFALPWLAIHYSPADSSFVLNIEKEKLKNAPGFDKDHWPDMGDTQWQKSIRSYYETILY